MRAKAKEVGDQFTENLRSKLERLVCRTFPDYSLPLQNEAADLAASFISGRSFTIPSVMLFDPAHNSGITNHIFYRFKLSIMTSISCNKIENEWTIRIPVLFYVKRKGFLDPQYGSIQLLLKPSIIKILLSSIASAIPG